jgi:glycolate oxidase FAD binding subunit
MSVTTDDLPGSAALAGRGSIRRAEAADGIEDVTPGLIVEPDTPQALADMLAWASRERRSVVLRGGGTKLAWGRRPDSIDLILSTARLNRVLAHAHGDLTATIEAGAALADANRELGRHRQWLPLDSPFDRATIGGTIATNDSGSLRQRYGTPRDVLIGIHLATMDGRLVKAGGNVVKNVAGYDLGKLISGSFGTLAAIVSATFKLSPVPVCSQTLIAPFSTIGAVTAAAAAVRASQLEPTAFDIHLAAGGRRKTSRFRLLLRFASTPDAIGSQIQHARTLMKAESTDVVDGDREGEVWRQLAQIHGSPSGAVVKMSWLAATLGDVLALVENVAGTTGPVEFVGRVAVGAGFVRVNVETAEQITAVERLRAAPRVVGNVVLLRAAPAAKDRVGVWGAGSDAADLLQQLKHVFDPAGVLNAGRGPV